MQQELGCLPRSVSRLLPHGVAEGNCTSGTQTLDFGVKRALGTLELLQPAYLGCLEPSLELPELALHPGFRTYSFAQP